MNVRSGVIIIIIISMYWDNNNTYSEEVFHLRNPHARSGARNYIGYILHEGRIYINRSLRVRFFGSHLLLPAQREERRETVVS